jgi:hypothetical protein
MKSVLLLALAACSASSALAQESPLVGVWRLVSYDLELKDGGPRQKLFGENPIGYLIFTSEGRMMTVFEAADRKQPTTVEERANLLNSMAAYTGTYRVEGDTWTTTVDAAWFPSQRGEQRRNYKIDGDLLSVTTPWIKDPRLPNQPETRSILTWQKVESP